MTSDTAQTVLYIALGVWTIVWLIGLWFLIASAQTRAAAPDVAAEHFALAEGLPPHWLLGSAEVDGSAHALVDKAASFLVKESIGAVAISEKTSDRLAFQRIGPTRKGWPQEGQLRFTSLGSRRTRIDYAIEPPASRWMLWIGSAFLVAGLVALVAGAWLIQEYCVPSPDPNIRGQTFQIVQVIHFLWQPFLWGGLYRHSTRLVRNQFAMVVQNLPHFPA